MSFNKFLKIYISIGLVGLVLFSSVSLVLPVWAQGASLYLSPLTGTYTINTNFSVAVKVDSGGVPINAAEATLIFDVERLRVVSISKAGSIFTLWTTEPTFSNTTGIIKWGGGTPVNFIGTAGKIITVTFKAQRNGEANINFVSGAVLAADGRGTNILDRMQNANYNIRLVITDPPPNEVPREIPRDVPREIIDTDPPKPFQIQVDNEGDPTNPSPILRFETIDLISGIDFYEIRVGDKEPIRITPTELKAEPFRLPRQEPEKHSVLVKAVDRVGNFTVSLRDFIVEAIESPIIIKFPEKLQEGDFLVLEGTSLPNYTVLIYVQKEKGAVISREIKADEQGNWLYIHPERITEGVYSVWVKNRDLRGAVSESTEKIIIPVKALPWLQIGKIAIDYLTLIITLILLIVGAVAIIFYIWHKISLWRKKLKKETGEALNIVDRTFRTLKEEVQKQIELLDKKTGLTNKEKIIRDKLQEVLDISEKFISKEIKDIEKELK
jgi:hypothetical protein